MTWTLAAFALLLLVLAVGFRWYEATQPSAKVLALVATLAALAALGRVAFAPIPNVKPTTDIVILAGFALGAAPGFAVGAVAAITSNLFFGQGPWTPWQMVGWGLCGLLGALLAVALRGREPSRTQLAVVCAVGGALFGVLLDLQEWLLYAPERTWEQYALVAGRSLPFNAAHVVGNVAFALAFGPAMLRMLARYRDRCAVVWEPLTAPGAAAVAPLLLVAVLLGGALRPAPAEAASTGSRALSFLARAQNGDGGWGAARGQRSSALYSAWALMGEGAARGGRCSSRGVAYVRRTGGGAAPDIERTILALRACRTGTGSLRARLLRSQLSNGSVSGLTNQTAFFVLALRADGVSAGNARVRRAATFVARQQNADGGFSFSRRGASSGIDDTAAALQALRAAGRRTSDGSVRRAVSYLRRRQQADGGFPAGGTSNAQSTAWAVQAFVAAGVDPERVRRNGSRSALAHLRSLAAPDGSIRYSRTSRQTPVWVTGQALTALARRPFPIR